MLSFVDLAVEESRKSHAIHQHGAVIIRNGRVVSTGFNNEKGHAEVNAIRNVYRLLRGSEGKDR